MSGNLSPSAPHNEPSFHSICDQERMRFMEKLRQFSLWNCKLYSVDIHHEDDGITVWYWTVPPRKDEEPLGPWSIRFHYVPNTKAARILRNEEDLPVELYRCNLTIKGNAVQRLEAGRQEPPPHPLHKGTLLLPANSNNDLFGGFNPFELKDITSKHAVTKPASLAELKKLAAISYLAQRRGLHNMVGAAYISTVVGRLPDGSLVRAPKAAPLGTVLQLVLRRDFWSIANVKKLFLQFIDAQLFLHECGLVGTSMAIDHVGFIEDDNGNWNIIIDNIRGDRRLRNHHPPESYHYPRQPWNAKADIFALGMVLWEIVYANNSPWLARFMALTVSQPFTELFALCTQAEPDERPSLNVLRSLVLAISDME